MHLREVQSKVEFYHNEHGNEDFNLPKPIPDGTFVSYRHRWQTVKGKKEKVLNAWIKYPDQDELIHVVKNRKWAWWNENGPNGKKDSDDVSNGPYLGKMHHAWVRNNGVGRIVVEDMVFREVEEYEE